MRGRTSGQIQQEAVGGGGHECAVGQQVGKAQRGGDGSCQVLELREQPHNGVGDDNADLGEAPNVPVCAPATTQSSTVLITCTGVSSVRLS